METNSREYQKAVRYLCDEIKDGHIGIGDRLPTERVLALKLSISRNSTREALRTLENMGLIESKQGSGSYFTGNVSKKFSEMIRLLILTKLISKKDICDFRRTMEKSVCLIIIKKEDFDFTKLTDILTKKPHSIEETAENDRLFHLTLVQASDNRFWIEMMNAICDVYHDWFNNVLQSSDAKTKSRLHKAHENILYAIKLKDRDACENAIDEHYDIIDSEL